MSAAEDDALGFQGRIPQGLTCAVKEVDAARHALVQQQTGLLITVALAKQHGSCTGLKHSLWLAILTAHKP
eukprot:386346-Pelagomonas_calceolata.AAC.1